MTSHPPALAESEIFALERPEQSLLIYYAATSLLLGPFFFFALIPLYFRYHTMRYRFDDEGVSMRWGVLFRREINLTYARIQDIHLVSNVVERWLGLAKIKIQTASGSSKAEMTIEGIAAFESLRDFLYARMRGTRDAPSRPAATASSPAAGGLAPGRPASGDDAAIDGSASAELAATLRSVAEELRLLRQILASGAAGVASERPEAPSGGAGDA